MAAALGFNLATSLPSNYYSGRALSNFKTPGPKRKREQKIEKTVVDAADWARGFATNIERTDLQGHEKKPSAARAHSNRGNNKRLATEITPERQDDLPPSSSQQDPSLAVLNRFLLADIIKLSNESPSVFFSLLVVDGRPLYKKLTKTTKHAFATISLSKSSSKTYLVVPGCSCESKLRISVFATEMGPSMIPLNG
jgi:hypothetical protein